MTIRIQLHCAEVRAPHPATRLHRSLEAADALQADPSLFILQVRQPWRNTSERSVPAFMPRLLRNLMFDFFLFSPQLERFCEPGRISHRLASCDFPGILIVQIRASEIIECQVCPPISCASSLHGVRQITLPRGGIRLLSFTVSSDHPREIKGGDSGI